jgi:Glycosyltransferase family 87
VSAGGEIGGAPARLERARLVRLAGTLVGLVVLATQLFVWLPLHARRPETNLDFPRYFEAAVHVAKGEPLYQECARYRMGEPPNCYVYPPPLAVALSPLVGAGVGWSTFQILWYAAILVAFWVYAFALVRLAGLPLTASHVLTAATIIQLVPGTTVTMSFGNADFMIWALCALAIGGGRWRPLLGAAAALKVYPAWILLTSLARRERDVLALVVAVAIGAASVAVVGVAGFRAWSMALSVLASGPRWRANVSIPVALVRLVGHEGGAKGFLVAVQLVGVPSVAIALRRRARPLREAAILVASLVLAPICWWYYAPILLIPAAAWWRGRGARLD